MVNVRGCMMNTSPMMGRLRPYVFRCKASVGSNIMGVPKITNRESDMMNTPGIFSMDRMEMLSLVSEVPVGMVISATAAGSRGSSPTTTKGK